MKRDTVKPMPASMAMPAIWQLGILVASALAAVAGSPVLRAAIPRGPE